MARIVMELLLSLLHMGIILLKNSPYDPSYYYVSEGMQEPLKYVGDRAKVKMIVPFKRGAYNDQSNGQPVYYEILEYIFEENL